MIEIIFIFILFAAVHYAYFIFSIYIDLRKPERAGESANISFVSVIVAFRNEAENLPVLLISLEKQSFPKDKFEVILVNDNSDDESISIIENFSGNLNLKLFSLPIDISGRGHKKQAIKFGIENSKGEIIITTDADCFSGENWISSMVKHFKTDTGFLSGPVKYTEGKNIFERIQQLEFSGLVFTGAGLINQGRPAICNGANIAYRRSAYEMIGGYSGLMKLTSGDDEIIMQEIAKSGKYKVDFCTNPESIVFTNPSPNIKSFIEQRRRWASKGIFYKNNLLYVKLIFIFIFFLSVVIHPLLILFYNKVFIFSFIISLGLKFSIDYLTLIEGSKRIYGRKKIKGFFISEIFHFPYIIISSVLGLFGNYKWKGRKVSR